MESVQKLLGRFLKEKRMEKGWTQEDLGIRVGYKAEAAKQSISQIERGISHISKDKAGKFIEALSIDEQWLIETLNGFTKEIQIDKSQDRRKKDLELALAGFTGLLAGSLIASKMGKPLRKENRCVNKKIDSSDKEDLKELKELFDEGLIDEREYREIKSKILKKMFSV